MKKQPKKIEEEKIEETNPPAGGEEVVIGSDLSFANDGSETEIEALQKKAQENLEGWQRSLAEFENYKKRSAEMQKDLIKYSTQNVILQILPVIDNFHASTSHIPEDQKDNPWVTGIMYIQRQLENVLTENGIEEIEVKIGDNFDPIHHEAIGETSPPAGGCDDCEDCKCEEKKFKNKIKKVLTKGYKIGPARNASHSDAGGGKVIRPARVVVE